MTTITVVVVITVMTGRRPLGIPLIDQSTGWMLVETDLWVQILCVCRGVASNDNDAGKQMTSARSNTRTLGGITALPGSGYKKIPKTASGPPSLRHDDSCAKWCSHYTVSGRPFPCPAGHYVAQCAIIECIRCRQVRGPE